MEEAAAIRRTSLTLIIEKGPRAGETLTYPPNTTTIKIGRVIKGNTIAIKDHGISSKHIIFQYDTQLSRWTLSDLDSSNGTLLNGKTVKPNVPVVVVDGDCVKIGELTSIVVKIVAEAGGGGGGGLPRRTRSKKGEPVTTIAADVGLGVDGGNEVKEVAEKRKVGSGDSEVNEVVMEARNVAEKRVLRSSRRKVAENVNVDVNVKEKVVNEVLVEGRVTRGRKRKMVAEQVNVETGLEEGKCESVVVPEVGRRTRGRRKGLVVVEALEENVNNGNNTGECLQVDEGKVVTGEKLSGDGLENMETNNESGQEVVVEKLVSTEGGCERTDVVADERLSKGKEVAEECMKDGCEKWDLEKMTLGDFFDYLEVQLPKEIYDKSEKIIADMKEKARKCHEFRLQSNRVVD